MKEEIWFQKLRWVVIRVLFAGEIYYIWILGFILYCVFVASFMEIS